MWTLYDYINSSDKSDIAEWARKKLQRIQRKKLRFKLLMLARAGPELPPGLLLKTEVPYVQKLKVQGNPKLRPMLCRGPLSIWDMRSQQSREEMAFTLLIGAKEISWKFEPPGADVEAGSRRMEVLNDPEHRRRKHAGFDD